MENSLGKRMFGLSQKPKAGFRNFLGTAVLCAEVVASFPLKTLGGNSVGQDCKAGSGGQRAGSTFESVFLSDEWVGG